MTLWAFASFVEIKETFERLGHEENRREEVCASFTDNLTTATGATLLRTSTTPRSALLPNWEKMQTHILRHPTIGERMTVHCGFGPHDDKQSDRWYRVNLEWESGFPPDAFFHAVADAGAAIVESLVESARMRASVLSCYEEASGEAEETGVRGDAQRTVEEVPKHNPARSFMGDEVIVESVIIECRASMLDGGRTTFLIFSGRPGTVILPRG